MHTILAPGRPTLGALRMSAVQHDSARVCLAADRTWVPVGALVGFPGKLFVWIPILTIGYIVIGQVLKVLLGREKASSRIFHKPHSWPELYDQI